jgi:DNA topoisomerase III
MKVIIAEKPSLAKNIVDAIDKNMKRGNGYFSNDEYAVTFAYGHLFKLYDVEMYKQDYDMNQKYQWNIDELPFYPQEFKFGLTRDDGIIKQFKIIRDLINRDDCEMVINAGDSDREGEIIVRIILKYALKKQVPIKRLWMPDQTPKTIKQELIEMKDDSQYDSLANEGLARTYIDWLYGINLTRFATIKSHTLLRVGRVIAPIVEAIYNREMAIINFVPRKYYVLTSKEKTNDEVVELTSKLEFENNELDKAKQKASEYNALQARVTNLTSEKKTIPPGKLYSLSKLQGDLGKKYKMSLDKSLKIVQDLYEKGYVSYPRTPSQYLAENEKNKFREIINNFKNLNVDLRFKDSKQIFDDSKIESHSAITPTYKIPNKKDLSTDEFNVYQTICHRFFAVFSNEDCLISRSTMEITLGDNIEVFKLTGDIVLQKGWTKFEDREKKDKTLPNLKIGDLVNINFKPQEKESTPPKRYTVESLNNFLKNPFKDNLKEISSKEEDEGEKEELEELKAMLDGIELGTEATRSGIIENATKQNYISLKDNVYKLEPMGKYYVETLSQLNIMMPKEKTAELGKSLKRVYRGEITIDDSIKLAENEIDEVFKLAKESSCEVGRPPRIFEVEKSKQLCKCPRCGNIIQDGEFSYRCCNSGCGLSLYKNNKLFEAIGKKLTKTMAKTIFTKGQIQFDDLISKKTSQPYSAILVADFTGKYVNFKFTFPPKEDNKNKNENN